MAESVQGMENKNRLIMWSTLSALLVLVLHQNVDAAPVKNRPFEKYMLDLYNALVDEEGQPRKGIFTMDDNIRCFLSDGPEASRSSSKISLSFDIREIQKDEKIIKASLIDPKSRKASVRTPTRFYPVSAADSKDSVQDLLNLSGGGWKSTDVTNKVKTWHKRRHKENTIHVYREGQEDDISSRNLHKILQAPFLVVHSRTNIKHAKSSQHEDENEAASLSKPDQRFHYPRSSSSQSCRMKKLEFKTSEIGWERSILANSNLKVNRCEGVCDARIGGNKNKTWNARFRAILASMEKTEDGKPITLPCCAPVDFTPVKLLSIKDVEGRKVTELKTFPNMVVKSCGCV